jgi:hypothetical protein
MKKIFLPLIVVAMSLLSLPAFSQTGKDTANLLGMAGDNLDLYAVLDIFQKSKTIEAFEKSLNDEKTKINNLDLDMNKKIDFIKVVTEKKGDSYTFILQVDVSKTEVQDVASILLDKDKDKKISMQIVGAEELYGKDYVIEPKGNSAITANPGYTGADPVTINVPAPTTTTVVVQSAPIVEYVYSPAYIPYVPPFYYGFYPPYFAMGACIAVGIYRANTYGYHGGYYGGHYGGGNTVVINNGNRNQINHNTSNTVANNKAKGNYGDNRGANRQGASASTRDAGRTSNRQGNGASASTRDAGGASNRQGNGASASTRDAGGSSNRMGNGASASTRQSSYGGSSSSSRNMGGGSSSSMNRGSGGYSGGGGSSMNRGGGGMSRGGGGGGRRR